MKNNPFKSKKSDLFAKKTNAKVEKPGKSAAKSAADSSERVNRTVYLTVAVLLIVLAVAVGLTSAANRARQNANDDTTSSSTTGTPSTSSPTPETTSPKPETNDPSVTTRDPDQSQNTTPVSGTVPTLVLPVEGYLGKEHDPTVQVFSNTLGEWRVHLGIDIVADEGTPVCAAADGKVQSIFNDPLWGKCVSVSHDGQAVTVYRNLSDTLADGVEVGAKVRAGEIIGSVGDTGIIELADESHLHFEMTVGGVDVDPLEYFSAGALEVLSSVSENAYGE